jgi:hypothetical protein
MDTKLICGKPFVKIPCVVCKGLIWVRKNKRVEALKTFAVCSDCSGKNSLALLLKATVGEFRGNVLRE